MMVRLPEDTIPMLCLPAFPTPGEHVGKTARKSKPGPVTTPAPTRRHCIGSAAHTFSVSYGATAKPPHPAAFNPYISGSLNLLPKRAEAT